MEIRAENISMKYMRQRGEANWFYGVEPLTLTVNPGELTVVTGRSGSGKTTLLNMLAGMQPPTEGKVYHGDTDIYAMSDEALSLWRGTKLGVVPQGRSLLDAFTVMENILLPAGFYGQGAGTGNDKTAMAEKAVEMLKQLEIDDLRNSRPPALSGGEIRRAAIIRALLTSPEFIFADEPTGDLDDVSTESVLRMFRAEADRGAAVLLVTHEQEALKYADRSYTMTAGKLR